MGDRSEFPRPRTGVGPSAAELGEYFLEFGHGGGGAPELIFGARVAAVGSPPVVVPVLIEEGPQVRFGDFEFNADLFDEFGSVGLSNTGDHS